MAVTVNGFAAFTPQQLIDRHARLSSLDVPERLIDATDGVVQYRTVLPVRAEVRRLPDVFDAVRGFPEQKGFQVPVDGRLDEIGALRERRAAVPVEAGLIGRDLHDREPNSR